MEYDRKRIWTAEDIKIPIGVGEKISYSYEDENLILSPKDFLSLVDSELEKFLSIVDQVDKSFSQFAVAVCLGIDSEGLENQNLPSFRRQRIMKLRMDNYPDGTQLYFGHPDLPSTPLVTIDDNFREDYTADKINEAKAFAARVIQDFENYKETIVNFCDSSGLSCFRFYFILDVEICKDVVAG